MLHLGIEYLKLSRSEGFLREGRDRNDRGAVVWVANSGRVSLGHHQKMILTCYILPINEEDDPD